MSHVARRLPVRSAVLAVLVVLVLGGGGWPWLTVPAEAGAAPGGRTSVASAGGAGTGGAAARPADVRSAQAQAARLSAQGAAYARAEHARARATALATLVSVERASVHAHPGVDPQLVAQLDAAVADLARTLRATAEVPEPALLGTRAGRAAARTPGGAAVAVSSGGATPALAGGTLPGGTLAGAAPGGASPGGTSSVGLSSVATANVGIALGGPAKVGPANVGPTLGPTLGSPALGGPGPASTGPAPSRAGTPDSLERRAQTSTLTRRVERAAERVVLLRTAVEAAERDAAARLDAIDALLATAQPPAALRAPGPATASSGTYLAGGIDPSGDPYPNGAIPLHTLCPLASNPRALLRCDAAAAFDRLAAAYQRDTGEPLRVTDSYRTFAAQVAVKAAKPGLAATPGRSNHGRGVAVDLAGLGGVGQFDRPAYLWLRAHAAEHGWYHPPWAGPGGVGPAEPWHWEFGGAPGGVFGALRPAHPQDPPAAPPAPVAPAPAAPVPGPVAPPGPVPGPVGPVAPAPAPPTPEPTTPEPTTPPTPEPTPTSGPPADPAPPEAAPAGANPPADAPPAEGTTDAGALTAPPAGTEADAVG